MRVEFAVVSCLLFVSAPLRAQHSPGGVPLPSVLYAGTSNGGDGGLFGTLDPATAHFTEIGDPTANGPMPGLACNSAGEFYGANNASGGNSASTLITIDPATGELLSTIGVITDDADDQTLGMTDIAFQPETDVLYGICVTNPKDGFLYTIDVKTAAATLVGDTGLGRGGLAFRDDGTLWLATNGSPFTLAQLDPSDGSVIDSVPTSTGMDSLAFRPSDDVLFAHEGEISGFYTIDPADGTVTLVHDDDVPSGKVTSLVFGPAQPVVPVTSYFLPKIVNLKLNTKQPAKSRIISSGFFDLGPDPVDLSLGATMDVGDYEVVAPSLEPNKKATIFKLKQAGLLFTVKPDKSGSSRALFRLKVQDDLAGLIDPDAALLLHFTSPAVDGQGEVTLEQGKYKLGKKRGELIAPSIYLFKVRGVLKGGGLDGLTLKAGFATDGTTPDTAPDLLLNFGDNFSAVVPSGSFVKKGDRFLFKGASGGVSSVVLDYLRETATIKAKGVDLGAFADGPQAVTVTLGLGTDVREVSVRMVKKGKALKY